jgi:hypothetical protein
LNSAEFRPCKSEEFPHCKSGKKQLAILRKKYLQKTLILGSSGASKEGDDKGCTLKPKIGS